MYNKEVAISDGKKYKGNKRYIYIPKHIGYKANVEIANCSFYLYPYVIQGKKSFIITNGKIKNLSNFKTLVGSGRSCITLSIENAALIDAKLEDTFIVFVYHQKNGTNLLVLQKD